MTHRAGVYNEVVDDGEDPGVAKREGISAEEVAYDLFVEEDDPNRVALAADIASVRSFYPSVHVDGNWCLKHGGKAPSSVRCRGCTVEKKYHREHLRDLAMSCVSVLDLYKLSLLERIVAELEKANGNK